MLRRIYTLFKGNSFKGVTGEEKQTCFLGPCSNSGCCHNSRRRLKAMNMYIQAEWIKS